MAYVHSFIFSDPNDSLGNPVGNICADTSYGEIQIVGHGSPNNPGGDNCPFRKKRAEKQNETSLCSAGGAWKRDKGTNHGHVCLRCHNDVNWLL